MRTFVALYVWSIVGITTTNQAAVNRKRHSREEKDFYGPPWISRYENEGTEAWSVGPEGIYNTKRWNNRGKGLKLILDYDYQEPRDTDWRYRHDHLAASQKEKIYDGSRVAHFGTIEGKWDLSNRENVERTLQRPAYEERGDLPFHTKNWTPKTNIRNMAENEKLLSSDGRQLFENQGSISWNVNGNSKLHLPDETRNEKSRRKVTSERPEDFRVTTWESKRDVTENQGIISGNASQEIYHKNRLWTQNKDEKDTTINPPEVRIEDQWPDRRSFIQKNNDYWYISDEHTGVAFVLPGILLASPHLGLLNGEWFRNTATAEMGDDLPWERNEKSRRKVTSERPEDTSVTTWESKWDVTGTTEKSFTTPDHLEHSKR